mmetsp:Transcript_18561/g.45686  ORF Transcript_18561/g.45686 Transcript_18561/m.45686 type:complete len:422 (+) Transcript_18561:44-1309(+)
MQAYLKQVNAALLAATGGAFGKLLQHNHPLLLKAARQCGGSSSSGGGGSSGSSSVSALTPVVTKALSGGDFANYAVVVAGVVVAVVGGSSGRAVDAFEAQRSAFGAFVRLFQADSGRWLLDALHSLSTDLRICAERADVAIAAAAAGNGDVNERNKWECLEAAARELNKVFQSTVTDRAAASVSKKWGALDVTNSLFRVYFRLNNLRLCKNPIRAIESDGLKSFKEKYPLSQLVTYNFFKGRLSMFDNDFESAASELLFAFENCSSKYKKNKKLILLYLVPVQLRLGRFPPKALLEKYDLSDKYSKIAAAIRLGKLDDFTAALAAHHEFFLRNGVYLILEQLRTLVYRNLFRAVHTVVGGTKLQLSFLQISLSWLGSDIDLDEIECLVANLIYKGYIKGYLSHSHRTLVLSKNTPFPRIGQ